jgi:hypothetical protein
MDNYSMHVCQKCGRKFFRVPKGTHTKDLKERSSSGDNICPSPNDFQLQNVSEEEFNQELNNFNL